MPHLSKHAREPVASDVTEENATQDPAGSGPSVAQSIEALSAHYNDNCAKLHRYAFSMVQDHHQAEDIIQQALANTIEAIEKGGRIKKFSSWLHRCIRNLAMDHLRITPTMPLEELEEMASLTTPQELANLRNHLRAVEDATHALPETQRAAFLLAEVRGLNYREIATVLNRTTGSTALLLHRARSRIRKIVGPSHLPAFGPLLGMGLLRGRPSRLQGLRVKLADKLQSYQQSLALVAGRSAEQLATTAALLVAVALIAAGLVGLPSQAVEPPDSKSLAADTLASLSVIPKRPAAEGPMLEPRPASLRDESSPPQSPVVEVVLVPQPDGFPSPRDRAGSDISKSYAAPVNSSQKPATVSSAAAGEGDASQDDTSSSSSVPGLPPTEVSSSDPPEGGKISPSGKGGTGTGGTGMGGTGTGAGSPDATQTDAAESSTQIVAGEGNAVSRRSPDSVSSSPSVGEAKLPAVRPHGSEMATDTAEDGDGLGLVEGSKAPVDDGSALDIHF